MKYVQTVRRELRVRTVFNLLGPLTNPARATCQVVGVYSADLVEKLAEALSMLGLRRALVVHGSDGLDEITITEFHADCRGARRAGSQLRSDAGGIRPATCHVLKTFPAETPLLNAALIREVLSGKKSARRDVVLLNAAAALVAAGRADHLREAMPVVVDAIDSGTAREKLEALIAYTSDQSK